MAIRAPDKQWCTIVGEDNVVFFLLDHRNRVSADQLDNRRVQQCNPRPSNSRDIRVY
jgi:hypothetical protein